MSMVVLLEFGTKWIRLSYSCLCWEASPGVADANSYEIKCGHDQISRRLTSYSPVHAVEPTMSPNAKAINTARLP